MPGFSISYGSYTFSNNGRAHFTRQARYESDAVGAKPNRAIVTYGVQQWFLEDTFAENQAKYQAMLTAIRGAPEGALLIKDENNGTLVNVTARPQSDNLPDQWGQHMAECTVEFQATELISNSTVDATLNGVTLRNVVGWRETMRTDRPTFAINDRRETIGAVTATGRILANPADNEAARRSYLADQRDAITGLAANKQGTLVFGTFSKLVRLETIDADIKDGSYELEWTLTATYRAFPTGSFTEVEYEVATRDDRERSKRVTSVRGKIRAQSLGAAQTKLAAITSAYLTGNRSLHRSDSSEQLRDGVDGIDNYNEITFTLEYTENLDLVNWTLTITDRKDARSGGFITTYTGRVTALLSSTALAKARDLGLGQYPIIVSSSESVTASQIDDEHEEFVECAFTYEYARQGTLVYAEVRGETNGQTFAESTTSVQGVVVAATQAAALTLARSFKPGTGVQLSDRETVSTQTNDGTNTIFIRVEFQYTFHAPPENAAIEYAEQVIKDHQTREITTTYSGVAIAATEGEADALIDAVIGSGRVIRDERTANWAQADETFLRTKTFSVSFVDVLEAGDDDILEADMTLATTYSIDHAVFTNIPFGTPFVQSGCGILPAVKQVSGTIRALNIATARTWGRGKRSLAVAGGFEDQPEERETTEYVPFSGTTEKAYRFGFTYSARFPNFQLS